MHQVVFLRLSFNGIENAVSFAISEAVAIFAEKSTWAWAFAGRVLFAFSDIASGATDAAASAGRDDVKDNSHGSYLLVGGGESCLSNPSIASCV